MLAIMLDLQFKSMKIVCEFVDNDAMVQGIMKEYDQKNGLPMLLQMYFHLNLVRLHWNFDLVKQVHDDECCEYGEKGEPFFTQKNDV
jgi:deoxyadenosine/deoxycytidine kinase